jgi:hypothetical protein
MSEPKLASKIKIRYLQASTTPKKVCTPNPTRKLVYVQVTDSNAAYVTDGQNKAYTEGRKLTATLPYENKTATDALWILTSTGTTECVIEEHTD